MEYATVEISSTSSTTVDNDLFIMPGHLTAIGMFAAKKDIRSYLVGVCIDTGFNGSFLVATCGHTLAVHQIDNVPREAGQFIMPMDTLQSMLKTNRKIGIKLTLPAGFAGKYDILHRAKRQVTLESLKGEISIVSEIGDGLPSMMMHHTRIMFFSMSIIWPVLLMLLMLSVRENFPSKFALVVRVAGLPL